MIAATLLVVAKAPVPGLAKTRLMTRLAADEATEIAAAALLDTLAAACSAPFERIVVAMTGDLALAARSREISAALSSVDVIDQRGDTFAERLVCAHRDAAGSGPIVQIGMDTPQITSALLADVGRQLTHCDAVLGLAEDGGWWVVGLVDASKAEALADVEMSTADTGAHTLEALAARGLRPSMAPVLRDVDEPEDLVAVASLCPPSGAFSRAVAALPTL